LTEVIVGYEVNTVLKNRPNIRFPCGFRIWIMLKNRTMVIDKYERDVFWDSEVFCLGEPTISRWGVFSD